MTTEIAIREELQKDSNNAVSEAKSMEVVSNETNKKAIDFVKVLKNFQAEIKAELRPAIDQANTLHKHLVAQEKGFLAPLQEAEKLIKTKVSEFLAEEERKRQEEQKKAREKAEAEDRKRREKLAKQKIEWEEKERKKREEAERLAAEGKAEEAKKAQEAADKAAEKAEERQEQAEEVHSPVPIVEPSVEKQSGVSKKVNWKFEITDKSKLPVEYLVPDEKAIGAVVRALKDKAKIDGVRVYSENSISVKA